MLYFILWSVFLLLAIVAVPVASMMDKRKWRAAHGGSDEMAADAALEDAESMDDADVEIAEEGEVEMAEDGDNPFGTDAFEELGEPLGEEALGDEALR